MQPKDGPHRTARVAAPAIEAHAAVGPERRKVWRMQWQLHNAAKCGARNGSRRTSQVCGARNGSPRTPQRAGAAPECARTEMQQRRRRHGPLNRCSRMLQSAFLNPEPAAECVPKP
eukprot:356488-Chlamydomonas_euryale.AAC.5